MKNLEKKVTKNLIKDYSNLLNGNSFKDFSIFVENKSNPFEIKVHKSILSSRSPFFNKFLREQNDIDKIFLDQFNKREMESILSYIYYGNISFENQENLFQLLEISIYFKLNLLKEIIQKKISNSINYSNFFQFLFQNRNLNSNEIEIKCFELINQNFSQVQNNENLFNLTEKEIIKFIQFKQEKKEIFQFDFFHFLNKWIKKRNQRLAQKKVKYFEKKRLFHSFFSLFDKDSISKRVLAKLKDLDFFPKSFLINRERKLFQENKKKDKKISSKRKEIRDKKKEIEEKWKKEVEEKDREIEQKNNELNYLKFENYQMKPIFFEYQKKMTELRMNFPQFSDSEIINEKEFPLKLNEWINDNNFFSKMKKGFSAKKDGFNSQNWHKAVDDKGKTLVIIKTKDNFIFGGFTQVGFTNDRSKWSIDNGGYGYIKDSNAFIFSLRNGEGNRNPDKFTIKKGQEKFAIYYHPNFGPTFGNDIALYSNLQPGYTYFGNHYNLPNGITRGTNEALNYLAGSSNKWVVDELETYFI
ncbi:hypothetical protein M0811_00335 [Anaeramoeba ignava]|uniref:BTB domain-containing protein n=1 Tax=Anaeramoeba ignava TaxID=1746090 RepID=A0A9Q0LTJ4_ANAIG|nr:hypothetical protein M0811_00335 [Anaeramoeba ignava]